MWITKERVFQAEGGAGVKALRQDPAWEVCVTAGRPG